jgi:hypothetical protein
MCTKMRSSFEQLSATPTGSPFDRIATLTSTDQLLNDIVATDEDMRGNENGNDDSDDTKLDYLESEKNPPTFLSDPELKLNDDDALILKNVLHRLGSRLIPVLTQAQIERRRQIGEREETEVMTWEACSKIVSRESADYYEFIVRCYRPAQLLN